VLLRRGSALLHSRDLYQVSQREQVHIGALRCFIFFASAYTSSMRIGVSAILLGEAPVRWFLHQFDSRWRRLADFGQDDSVYGRLHDIKIGEKSYRVLPLVHPRQAAKLGTHSTAWHELHRRWVSQFAHTLMA